MYSERPLTTGQRQFLAVFLGALPAIYLGFRIGLIASDVGFHSELGSIFLRGLICAAPAAVLALLVPRYWLLPSLIYGYGFYSGYTFGDSIATGLRILVALPFAALTGQRVGTPPQPSHAELPWLFLFAFWLAGIIYLLRRYFSRPNESA